ncbi:MAG: TrkA C-terminal domain-containing protein, partial [Elusimicrobiota bacterium]
LFPLMLMLGAGMFLWRGMNRLYAKLQLRLRETLEKGHARPEAGATVLSHLVDHPPSARVKIASFRIGKHAAAAGKAIRDLDLHDRTGASIIQINRLGEALPSPGPAVHLREGDEVLLVGLADEIGAAEGFLERGG